MDAGQDTSGEKTTRDIRVQTFMKPEGDGWVYNELHLPM